MKNTTIDINSIFNSVKYGIMYAFSLLTLISLHINKANAQNYPPWAPPYYVGARYYYMPDIETYYDIDNQDFIYLDNGQWLFINALPPMYSDYNLYNGFFITLNNSVYQPWMHHHLYVANYPRYYYRNRYRHPQYKDIRGFNENGHQPYYWKQEDRDRMHELHQNDKHETKPMPSRPPQDPNYNRKNVGAPVKVKPPMKDNKPRPNPVAAPKPMPQPRPNTIGKPQNQPRPNPINRPKGQNKPNPQNKPKPANNGKGGKVK